MEREPDSNRAPDRRGPERHRPPAGSAPALPAPVFPAVLAVLLAVAIASTLVTRHTVEGMPPDPSARAARDLLYGRVAVATGELRFGSVFFGDSLSPGHAGGFDPQSLDRAHVLLERAHEAHPFEPRVVAALGHVELVRRRLATAEALYRSAIDLRSYCTEARLGLGVTLSVEADGTVDLFERRALQLRALAQFLAIAPGSERRREALYDRALLEERVGRHRDALESASAYFAIEPAGPWADRLRRALGAPGPASARVTDAGGRSSAGTP